MLDYYSVLGVRRNASLAEIKSAYRSLARQKHPDLNAGSEASSRDFAIVALAYRTLSDPHERASYDARRDRSRSVDHRGNSVFHSANPHARRMRRMAVQARWDRAVDHWMEAERRETLARTQAVFTTVTLFVSTFIVATLKPRFWYSFDSIGRAIMITLFLIGLWHITSRLKACFERYTYQPKPFQESIMRGEQSSEKPFTRFSASAFLLAGYAVSIAAGLFVGEHMYYVILSDMPFFFDPTIRPDLFFYPPIAVLIVDTMHTIASKID